MDSFAGKQTLLESLLLFLVSLIDCEGEMTFIYLLGKIVMLLGIDVYHAKMRFLEKSDVYVQRRSVGAFVAIFIDVASGRYLTSNHVVEVKARVELLCKAESGNFTYQNYHVIENILFGH